MEFTTLDDIIRFAVQREETAYLLYMSAAKKTESIAARKMFEEMAHEEAAHKASFEKLTFAEYSQDFSPSRDDMKLSEYMVDIPFRSDMEYPEILHYAMKTEESAYQLYSAAAEMTDDPNLKKMLLALADIEKGHKVRVEALYDERVLTEM